MCGGKAEVYSRITGYYRPVQNWNDGKAQEYKNRKLYDMEHSTLKKVQSRIVTVSKDNVDIRPAKGIRYLFTTKTCPNCSIAKRELEKAGIAYQVMDVNEHRELVARYGIQQAPTLIVRHGEQVEKLVNASTIKKFATSQSV